jgi:hypothetical protein
MPSTGVQSLRPQAAQNLAVVLTTRLSGVVSGLGPCPSSGSPGYLGTQFSTIRQYNMFGRYVHRILFIHNPQLQTMCVVLCCEGCKRGAGLLALVLLALSTLLAAAQQFAKTPYQSNQKRRYGRTWQLSSRRYFNRMVCGLSKHQHSDKSSAGTIQRHPSNIPHTYCALQGSV